MIIAHPDAINRLDADRLWTSSNLVNAQLVPQIRSLYLYPQLQPVGPAYQGVPASQKQSPAAMADDHVLKAGVESAFAGYQGMVANRYAMMANLWGRHGHWLIGAAITVGVVYLIYRAVW